MNNDGLIDTLIKTGGTKRFHMMSFYKFMLNYLKNSNGKLVERSILRCGNPEFYLLPPNIYCGERKNYYTKQCPISRDLQCINEKEYL